jgi:poly(3-hydroxybutyrate) depolymerase
MNPRATSAPARLGGAPAAAAIVVAVLLALSAMALDARGQSAVPAAEGPHPPGPPPPGAHGSPARLTGQPCAGCLASLPASAEAAPLLVLLHGDFEPASRIYAKWRGWAEERGIAVLAPACPVSEGCKGSWWRWNGEAAWLEHQIDALGQLHAIDRERLWVVGWSGGASYLGWRTQELERTFAAVVIHGGGMAPANDFCPRSKASVYFLVGDKNPLHALAVDLRAHYEACGQDVQWSLLPGAAHDGEWDGLDASRGKSILDWLATKRRAAVLAAP